LTCNHKPPPSPCMPDGAFLTLTAESRPISRAMSTRLRQVEAKPNFPQITPQLLVGCQRILANAHEREKRSKELIYLCFQDDCGPSRTMENRKRQESNLPKTPARPPTGLKPARPTGSGTLPRRRIAGFFATVNRRCWAVFQTSPGDPFIRSVSVPKTELRATRRAIQRTGCGCRGLLGRIRFGRIRFEGKAKSQGGGGDGGVRGLAGGR
jgi:hypothetical protein